MAADLEEAAAGAEVDLEAAEAAAGEAAEAVRGEEERPGHGEVQKRRA